MKISPFDEVASYEVLDDFLNSALQGACDILFKTPEAEKLGNFAVCVYNPDKASPELKQSDFAVSACQVFYSEKAIIFNEVFLREIEAALRAFGLSESLLGSQYLKDDDTLFALISRITVDPGKHARRLRKIENSSETSNAKAIDPLQEMVMAIFFFASHEIGHLLCKQDRGRFSTFLDPNAPLESSVAHAVVKLCRHADEFQKFGFGLSGFEKATDVQSDVRQSATQLEKSIEDKATKDSGWFVAENSADLVATEMTLRYLEQLSLTDPEAAGRRQYHLICAMFVIGIYFWHKDLRGFADALGLDGFTNSQVLSTAMMTDRKQYVHAASLFGNVHRFTLLRSVLAIEAVLRKCTNVFTSGKRPSLWYAGDTANVDKDLMALRDWRICESLQRYYLLAILMDTAVKIAHVGCSTGWILQADKKRGTPQLLVMNFESLRQAMTRLRNIA